MCWVVMDRFGRRWPMCLCMIIGGIFDIATVLLPDGKFSQNISFPIIPIAIKNVLHYRLELLTNAVLLDRKTGNLLIISNNLPICGR